MYQTMKIESLSKVIPFFDFSVVEKISVDAVKNSFIAMKVDHMKGVILFGNLVSFVYTLVHNCSLILSLSLSHMHMYEW